MLFFSTLSDSSLLHQLAILCNYSKLEVQWNSPIRLLMDTAPRSLWLFFLKKINDIWRKIVEVCARMEMPNYLEEIIKKRKVDDLSSNYKIVHQVEALSQEKWILDRCACISNADWTDVATWVESRLITVYGRFP